MRGEVEIVFLNNGVEVGRRKATSNLTVDGARETIVDALTISPSLSAIPSASSILDTSNYTIHAMSLGKAASQYTKHAHSPDVSSLVIGDGRIRTLSTQILNPSSYATSAQLNPGLPLVPNPIHTKLEIEVTSTNFSSVDVGHNLNMIPTSATNALGASAGLVGCYPTSSTDGTPVAIVSSRIVTGKQEFHQ